jgi:FAD synthase
MDWSHLYISPNDFAEDERVLLSAKVVHGFKRGSKELGIPTANLDMDTLGEKGKNLKTGIYYGFACINPTSSASTTSPSLSPLPPTTHLAVVSVGWNPFYDNEKKAIEAHLIVESELEDFYGEELRVLLCGYLRDETSFNGLEDLISCINCDIDRSKERLQSKNLMEVRLNPASWQDMLD